MKSARESLFWLIFGFFHGQKFVFQDHFFYQILNFFAAPFISRTHFCFFFSTVKQNRFHGQKSIFFSFSFQCNREKKELFHGHRFQFHGLNFSKNLTAKFNFHGYYLRNFCTISGPLFQIFKFFFTGMILIFEGEKNSELT